METNLPDLYASMGSFGFSFKLIILFFSEKYSNFIHRQGAADYKPNKAHGSDFSWGGGGGITVALETQN